MSEIKQNLTDLTRGTGMKYDAGKARWYMLMEGCRRALAGVMGVLEFGARKYSPDSWKTVDDGMMRYKDALYRHLHAIESGELNDPESGQPHIDHVVTNALFISELLHEQLEYIEQARK